MVDKSAHEMQNSGAQRKFWCIFNRVNSAQSNLIKPLLVMGAYFAPIRLSRGEKAPSKSAHQMQGTRKKFDIRGRFRQMGA